MFEVDRCLGCGSQRLRAYPALLSPFIAGYALGAAPRRVRLFECSACGLQFYSSRYDSAEIRRLYEDYRGEDYFRARHRSEFWYSKKINDRIGQDPAEIAFRNASASEFIGAGIALESVGTVLDYGGDRGQFIPPGLGRERAVFDISGSEPVAGVSRIASQGELAGRSFDLILLAHVLEHCSQPAEMLDEIRALAHADGSDFMIEVPWERYGLAFVPARGLPGRAYEKFLDFLAASPRWAALVDFYSTAFRLKFNAVPPLGFLKMHEHINFFDENSLRTLLEKNGFTVLACRTLKSGKLFGFGASIQCLARAARPGAGVPGGGAGQRS